MYGYKPPTLDKISTKDLILKVAQKTGLDQDIVEKVVDQFIEEVARSLENCHPVNIKNFGTFFIRPTAPTRTFKFNLSQKLRSILGWSSKYKG